MKKLFSVNGLFIVLMLLASALFLMFSPRVHKAITSKINKHESITKIPYNLPIDEAYSFVRKSKMDTGIAILINYHQHSGRKRLYIIDLKKKCATDSFLVAHGCGPHNWGADESKDNPSFSNEPESHCSSLGKYRIGKRAYSDWGINVKYYLFGLEKSNSNAYKRIIVLHGWGDVADDEIYPYGVPEGWGCPAVSDKTMTTLDSLLSAAKKPVLLWTFY